MKAATYLHFKNNAKEVIETYQSLFGAEVINEYVFEAGMTDNPDLLGKIFHAELKIGDLNLYLSDTGQDESYDSVKFVIEISGEALAQAQLSRFNKYGKIIQNFTKLPIGPTIGHAEDKFGIKWDIVIC